MSLLKHLLKLLNTFTNTFSRPELYNFVTEALTEAPSVASVVPLIMVYNTLLKVCYFTEATEVKNTPPTGGYNNASVSSSRKKRGGLGSATPFHSLQT